MEHKKIKQDIHARLMRECGGTGKHFSNPPINYVTDNVKSCFIFLCSIKKI